MKLFAFLKDSPLTSSLRILALIIILSIVGVNLTLIQRQIQNLKRGSITEIGCIDSESKGYAVINRVIPEGNATGISMGDIVLNPQACLEREIGIPVTFLIKSDNAPVREVTFTPKPRSSPGYFLTLLKLSPRAIMYLQIIFLWTSLLFMSLFSIVAFWRHLDAWLVFLVILALSHLCALVSENPHYSFFKLFIPSALIFFLIVFPTGKFVPRWSWLLVFIPLPSNIGFVLGQLGILEQGYYSLNFSFNVVGEYSTVSFLIILWAILYESRNKFTLFKRRWVNWLILGLILVNLPYRSSFLLFLGLPRQVVFTLNLANTLHLSSFAYSVFRVLYFDLGLLPMLIVLGVVIYRYHNIFNPVERQQMKWLVFGLIWSVGLFAVYYMFALYYHSSNQYSKAAFFSSVIDKFFLLAVEATVFCVLLAIFRYRLNDIDTLINHAFVYSGLIIVAGAVCLLSTMLVDSSFGKLDSQNNVRTLATSMVLIALIFNPARRWLQKFVDEHFGSEEFDLAETFYEFAPEMRAFFTMPELSKILVERSVEQFGVNYASVYLKNKDGNLQHIKTVSTEKKRFKPVIGPQALAKLEEGELVFPGVDSTYSLILPLIFPHGRKSDFVGALVLGQRLDGLGYPTARIKKLKSFGQEAGKVLYTARLQGQSFESPAGKSVSKPAL